MSDHADWLRGELPALLRDGVIDAATAERLGRRYAAAPAAARPLSRALVVCALRGALLIGSGLILIIAHDWDAWPKPARLAMVFGPLLAAQGLGAWVLHARTDSRAWREAVALALALAGAAVLALVGQIYHYPGELSHYLLAVSLLALPLVYAFDAAAVAALVLIGFTAWQLVAATAYAASAAPLRYLALLALLLPFGWRLLAAGASWRANLLGTVCAGCLVAAVVAGSWGSEASLLLRLALLAAIFTLAGSDEPGSGRGPLLRIGRHGGALLALAATWRELWPQSYSVELLRRDHGAGFVIGGWLPIEWLAWAALLGLTLSRSLTRGADWWLLAAMPVAAWLGVQISLGGGGRDGAALLFDAYALALGIAVLQRGLASGRLALMNQGLGIVAALILMRFFDSEWPFLVRGLAFIGVGGAFLGTNLWLRRRVAA